MTSNSPHSLRDWQKKLQRLQLPVDPAIKIASLQKLHARNANADNIAALIQRDPALSLQLMVEANKTLSLAGNETHSLSHSLSLLGFPQVEALIRQLPDYTSGEFPQLVEYQQQLSVSLHAAHQAQAWMRHNPHWQQPGLFWATLFQRAPLWALWYQAGEQMSQLEYVRATHRGAQHSHHEQQLLGCNLQTLAASLSRQWRLPQLSQHSWQPGQRGKARHWIMLSRINPEQAHLAMEQLPRLQQLRNHSPFIVALANELAEAAEWNWYSRRTLRVQKILAAALQQPLSATIALSHQQAVAASHGHAAATLAPAKQLISFYHKASTLLLRPPPAAAAVKARPDSRPATATTPMAKPAVPPVKFTNPSAPPSSRPSPQVSDSSNPPAQPPPPVPATSTIKVSDYDAVIERILQRPESFNSVADLIKLALATLCQQLKLERASASLADAELQELRTRFSYGADDSPALKHFQHCLQTGDLFSRLLQKPLSVRLQSSNYRQIWPLLPGNFKQACGADEFFMMSVFAGTKPIAILYADHGNSNRPLSDEQYQQFKLLCRSLCHCLPSLT